jgi:transcriptional regulator with XRE-family HTH domain
MKERILEFLRMENKSSAQFAEEIGVQPSGISHIISGRNNPSLDFIVKMLEKYPSLSADWLLFGRGKMFRDSIIGDLFDSVNFNAAETYKLDEGQLNESNKAHAELRDNSAENQSKVKEHQQSNKAIRIICFFDNNTFTEYFPSK